MRFLGVLNALLNSRKAVLAAAFLIGGAAVLLGYNDVTPALVISYLAAGGYLIGEVIKAIRDEDVAAKTAAGVVAAANVTANTAATTTTVSTPGGSDVTVIAPSDETQPQPSPMLGRMG